MGDPHVGRDLHFGRESLADALRQSESGGDDGGPPFDWDIAVCVGDYSGEHGVPRDPEGEEIVRQFGVLKNHRREQIYSVCGNHDRSGKDEPDGWWFRKWIDPMGENTAHSGIDSDRYPYPVDGTWERYSFRVGNAVFLMMSDVNEAAQDVGRGPLGGNPSGVVTRETFEWWRDAVARHEDDIVVCAHHYVLKDTTVASGDWEGMKKKKNGEWGRGYHRYFEQGTPVGASYLYWVGGEQDSGAFESHLTENPGAVDIWFGGHTHTNPDDTHGGKSHIERRWGTTFMNVCPLTRYMVDHHAMPHSRLLTFTDGSDAVRVQCYMHTSEYRPQGWYAEKEATIHLSRPFRIDG
jgi:hypothetical protein